MDVCIYDGRTLKYIMLDGNPMGPHAVEVLKQLKMRMLEGTMQRFSLDNCAFDPLR
jgi:hypothetical protein